MVRVRFAPSPTGYLHVGGLRTALFNYLFAKHHQGTFVFRLEDTDQQRLVEGADQSLLQMLHWAGIEIDEGPGKGGDYGPYRQSERLAIYRQHLQTLLDKGFAYPCFCSQERLEALKTEQQTVNQMTGYDGHCRNLDPKSVQDRINAGEAHVIRMKIPEMNETLLLQDLIRGNIAIETDQLEDQVLLKSDGFPTYHLAVVIDDHLMKITHVIRGEEWLPSFPKHLLLFRYFGWEPPQFAHLSLILNPDRSKLSKRQGDVSVEDFRAQGYLPEAMINFIALLGWHTAEDRELFTFNELVEAFTLERIGKTGSVFDKEKLNWMNQQYMMKLDPHDFYQRLKPFIEATPYAQIDEALMIQACAMVQTRLITLKDIQEKLPLFFDEAPTLSNPELIEFLRQEESKQVLNEFLTQVDALEHLDASTFTQIMKQVQKVSGIKGKPLWLPVRYAITFEEHGPELPLMVSLFGKEKCIKMIRQALEL
ncbi:glutamate--tRNA ligase [Deltaproteobacteria bacterium TL4]